MVLLRGTMEIYSSGESAASGRMNIQERQLQNIAGEFEYITGMASLSTDPNYSSVYALSNFSRYVRSSENAKILWVSVYVNGSSGNYSVNIGNYLQRNIYFNVSPTSSSPTSAAVFIPDYSNSSLLFSAQSNCTINLTLTYSSDGSQVQDTFQFAVSNSSSVAGFFDISLLSDGFMARTKRSYQVTIQ